jgi:hypothetical protein
LGLYDNIYYFKKIAEHFVKNSKIKTIKWLLCLLNESKAQKAFVLFIMKIYYIKKGSKEKISRKMEKSCFFDTIKLLGYV